MSEQPPDPANLPKVVADDETIVRAIMTPKHLKRGGVRWQALKPPRESSDVSVMRQIAGDCYCKTRGAHIGSRAEPKDTYDGLLVVCATNIRTNGAEIRDSREVWIGHADLDYHVVVPLDDPPEEGDYKVLLDRIKAILKTSLYHRDPAPKVAGWSGPPLKMP